MLRAGMWRSMSTDSRSSAGTPTKEELIARYPFKWPWGQTLNFKTPTGEISVRFADAPGLTQHKLIQVNDLAKIEMTLPPPFALSLSGKSGRGAHALMNGARDANCGDLALSTLGKFIEKYKSDSKIVGYFHVCTNTTEMQRKFLVEHAQAVGAPQCVCDALLAMHKQKRLRKLPELRRMFNRLVVELKKEKSGSIVSAEPLTEQQYATIAAKMQKLVTPGESLKIDRQVEPEILGGLVIRVGNKIQDLSVSSQIFRMETHLKAFFANNQTAVDKVLATS